MIVVPKIGFGCVGMANNVIGAELCPLAANIFLPYFQQAVAKLAPSIRSPSNLTLFEGLYTPSIPGFPYLETTINITASFGENSKDGDLFYIDTENESTEVITWLNGNTFAFVANYSYFCELLEMGTAFEHIQFQTDPNDSTKVVSFTLPGTEPWYGIHWYRNN